MCESKSLTMRTGKRDAIGLILVILILSTPPILGAGEMDPTPSAIIGSIGMLKTPEKYPPDFLLMAAEKLAHAPPSWLPTILLNMEDCNYTATNLMKWSGDQIVQRNARFLDAFPVDALQKTCDDLATARPIREASSGWLSILADQIRDKPRTFTAFPFIYPPARSTNASDRDMRSYWSTSYGVQWKVPLPGTSIAAPYYVDNCVISLTQPNRFGDLMISCLDEATGILQWSHVLSVPASETGLKTSPGGSVKFQVIQARDAEFIVLHGVHGLAAFSTRGDLRWIRALQPDLQKMFPDSQGDLELKLIATKDEVFLEVQGSDSSHLICLDAEDGQPKWKRLEPCRDHLSPMLVDHKSGLTLITFATDRIEGLSPEDGEVRWTIPESNLMCCTGIESGTSRIHYESIHQGKSTLQIIDLESCGPMRSELPCDLQNDRKIFAFKHQMLELTPENQLVCRTLPPSEILWSTPLEGDVLWPPLLSRNHLFLTNLAGKTLIFGGTEALSLRGVGDLGEPVDLPPVESKNGLIFQTQTHLISVQPPAADRIR